MSVFYLTIAGYIVVGGAGVGVFLYGKEHGNSIFDRLYRIFCMHLPRVLKKAFKGHRAYRVVDSVPGLGEGLWEEGSSGIRRRLGLCSSAWKEV